VWKREVFDQDANFGGLVVLTEVLQLLHIEVKSYSTKYRKICLNEANVTNCTEEVRTHSWQLERL
jgi:hypothetical protein